MADANFKRVLIAVGAGDTSVQAARVGLNLAKALGAESAILNVVEPLTSRSSQMGSPPGNCCRSLTRKKIPAPDKDQIVGQFRTLRAVVFTGLVLVLNKSHRPALAVLLKLRFGRNHHPVWQENILDIGGSGHPDLWTQPYGARHRPVLGSARRGGDRL